MNITTLLIIILAVVGIVWAYPRMPSPWNFVLVIIVAIVCVMAILNLSGVGTGISFN